MSYTRTGAAHSTDRKSAAALIIFVIIVGSTFFVALGGLDIIFPEPSIDPKQAQLYRLYVVIESKGDNYTESFYNEITVFNDTIIADKFSIRAYVNTTSARGSGNVLWSLQTINEVKLEIESVTPVGFGFQWFDTISSGDVSEMAPSESNMYEWLFEYGSLYWIRVQLGPRLPTEG